LECTEMDTLLELIRHVLAFRVNANLSFFPPIDKTSVKEA
jgi:hypothetical protein